MAQISVTIPDAALPRVLDAFASSYQYKATVPDPANPSLTIPNPQTKAQFARSRLISYMQDIVRAHEANAAAETARVQAATGATIGLS